MEIDYVGSELELFKDAHNWKHYFASLIRPHLGARVLEVGAGIGGTTAILCDGSQQDWCCLEPDAQQAGELSGAINSGALPDCCRVIAGTLEELPADSRFDTILYVDVLEHIEDDRGELARAASHLAPSGRLVVLSPAHQWLFSPFDAAVGHYRRYNFRQLAAAAPATLTLQKWYYLDACGTLLSIGNRLLLRRSMPTRGNINTWDRYLVPLSRLVDKLTLHRLGKTILAIWHGPPR